MNIKLWAFSLITLLIIVGIPGCKSPKNLTSSDTPAVSTTTPPETPTPPTPPEPVIAGQTVPFDPETRLDRLDNGLTYYIKKNPKPENFAELRLAINVGSILEDEDQLGLAHFVEHMCFNGTKNFPKQELVDYLEGIGTKFGAHLNAYTSFDETVYMLKIPTDDQEKFDKGLQILEDWAHNVSFEPEEIDKERGVVISEWRSRLGAQNRMMQKTLPKTFYGSKYADRLPIGTTDVLENFSYETLSRYYKDWYRPELMAVVVVGDIDVDQVEKMIKEKFGRIPASPENVRAREFEKIPDHAQTLVAIAADEETPFNNISVINKQAKRTTITVEDYRENIVRQLANNMLQNRLSELSQSANPPFNFAFGGYGAMARTKDAFQLTAYVAPTQFEDALRAILTEKTRASKYGFTASELERAKKSRLASLEKSFKEKDKTPSQNIVMNYVQHYLNGRPELGPEQKLKFSQKVLPSISLEEVNKTFKSMATDDNQVITVNATQKEGIELPTEAALLAIVEEVKNADIEKYEDDVASAPLMEKQPAPGSIVSETELKEVGATKWKLSNGVSVILKPTSFKDDEIQMDAFSWGGSSLASDEDYLGASLSDYIISSSGVAGYNEVQLGKYLSDKVVRVSPYIYGLSEGIEGSSSVKDLETMFQLTHLYFTQPRKDENGFNSVISEQKSFLGNMLNSPQAYFSDEISKIMYNNHPRNAFPTEEKLNKVDLNKIFTFYQDRFADASDFTFVFVGNFEVNGIKPLIETYIASLPNLKRKESYKDVGMTRQKGVISKEFKKGKEPKSQVRLMFHGDFDYSEKKSFDLDAATRILNITMRESMREDKGGVYGVQVYSGTSRRPKESFSFNVSFTCDPNDVEELIRIAKAQIKDLQNNGPSEKNMSKIKEIMRKENETALKQNGYWVRGLGASVKNQTDPAKLLTPDKKVEALTAEEVQNAAKQFLNGENFAQFILYPEIEKENE